VHLQEPPGENAYPFSKVYVERNVVDLDPEPNGTLTNDNIIEVRADEVGTLDVGPISLGAELGSSSEMVEVEFRALGKRLDGTDRSTKSSRFLWRFEDQNEPRYWRVFTGQLDFRPDYQYRVHVTVKGTLFSKGQAWTGPWVDVNGNGSLLVTVPAPTDAGVVPRQLTTREILSTEMVRAIDPVTVTVPVAPVPTPTPAEAPVAAEEAEAPRAAEAPVPSEGPAEPPREVEVAAAAEEAPWDVEVAAMSTGGRGMPTVRGYGVLPSGSRGGAAVATAPRSVGLRHSTGRATEAPRETDAGEWVEAPAGAAPSRTPQKQRSTKRKREEPEENGWYEIPPEER
jgi:hypothetical protein